ncbi:hypothetical protein [Pelagibacterium sediminicola]|uniref:hypothetical protein n=1 Tax=Pelagibacterium sediminicola TaxID=2248761 RepID=UPI0013003D08|nr:hypothetical protein [Pelagibacterium sediminicola]
MKLIKVLGVAVVMLIGLGVLGLWWSTQTNSGESLPRIAHAGGGYNEQTYTNSHEALDANANHYDLFEIDFVWASDGELVCIHDWAHSAELWLGREYDPPPTTPEFLQAVKAHSGITSCTIRSLITWLDANPTKKIVTDIKEDNLRGLELISELDPKFAERFVPQIYQPQEFPVAEALGFNEIIWTLYQYPGTPDQVLQEVADMDLFAVTMPTVRAVGELPTLLGDAGISTYVHTINDIDEAEAFFHAQGIDGIYTDWLQAR